MGKQAKWFLLVGDLLKVGFSLQGALTFTMAMMKKEQEPLESINRRLLAGKQFADSVRPFVKPDLYYQLLLAEKHGHLVTTLQEIGSLLVTKQRQKQKLRQLLQYPLLLLSLLGLLVAGLSTYVFPELRSWQQTPYPAVVGQWRPIMLCLGIGLAILLVLTSTRSALRWRKMNAIQRANWLSGLPLFGRCYRLYYGYYVTSTIAILLRGGLSLKEILLIVERFSTGSLLHSLGQTAKYEVSTGGSLENVIAGCRFLPGELMVLISKGATVKELGADLNMLARLQFRQLLAQLEALLTMVQPVIFIVIAMVIVALYLSILLPIYHSIQGVY